MTRSIELATILLTDLEGSTAAAARLGPAGADALRDRYFTLLRRCFAAFDGREFKNSGDGLWAAFGSASAAVLCAARIQQELHGARQDSPDPLKVRIGLSAGESTVDDGDYFGLPSIEAARLCDRATSGGVLVSAAVRLLAGRCDGVTFTSIGPQDLKGLPEPMEVFELGWPALTASPEEPATAATESVPVQATLLAGASGTFVGRGAERGVLDDALAAADRGERRLVLLSGEAGMGKTRLAADFALAAHDRGAWVLYGRCEQELAVPYRPWMELLDHLVEHTSDEEIAGIELAELSRLVPALRRRRGVDATGDPDQYALFGAVARLVAAFARHRTVVVVLDDLHWADRESVQLLTHVVAAWSSVPVLIIGTFRDTDLGVDHPMTAAIAQLHRQPGVDRITLTGLTDVEVTSLVSDVAGLQPGASHPSLADALTAETSGSPFFVIELVRHLLETGTLVREEGHRRSAPVDLSAVELPTSVRAVVDQRVRRLGDPAVRVLSAAAVVGREFEGTLLSSVLDVDEETVLDVLEEAIAAGLVREVSAAGRFAFTHALVRHALYRALSATRRARLHAEVAQAMEALPDRSTTGRAGELANHLFAAVRPAEVERATGYAVEAGRQALAAAAPAEAVRWFRRALDVRVDEDRLHVEILVLLGTAERQAGRGEYREHLLHAADAAERHGFTDLLCAAAIENYRGFHSTSGEVDAERVRVLESALGRLDAGDSPERARLLATLAGELTYGAVERRYGLCREAREIAHRIGDAKLVLDALLRTGSAMNIPDLFEERSARAEEALRISVDSGTRLQRFFAIEAYTNAAIGRADMSAMLALDRERQEIAAELGQPQVSWMAMNAAAQLHVLACRTDDAERTLMAALELGRETGQPDAMAYFGGMLFQIRQRQGRVAELVDTLRASAAAYPGIPGFTAGLTFALAERGDLAEAREAFTPLASRRFEFPKDVVWLPNHAITADAAAEVGDRDSAAVLYEILAPYAHLVTCTRANCFGAVAFQLGRLAETLGDPERAESHLVSALEINTRLGSPYDVARTHLELARVRRDPHPDRAASHARAALALAEEHALPRQREQAQALLEH